MKCLRSATLIAIALLGQCAFAEVGWRSLGDLVSLQENRGYVELTAQRGKVRIEALSPAVIRVTYGPDGNFSKIQSFAVLPNALSEKATLQVRKNANGAELRTEKVVVRVSKSPLRISFLDATGKPITEEAADKPASFNGTAFRMWRSMPEDEHYFGLGDKTGPLDHRDEGFTMWNTDAFGWQESTDPLYKDVPFFLGVRSGAAYGIFLDNTYRTNFEFGKEFWNSYSFGSDGGPLDYYFFYGPNPKQVVEEFTQLVGRVPLPPLFALGFQQCRYSYYPESQVREIAAQFRKRQIPADVIYLDIDYQQNNRPFAVDRERFPNFEGMIRDLGAEGFKVVAITDLHIAKFPGYKPYDEGLQHGYFVKNPDGSVYTGIVWPGESVFPDFTRKEVRDWWGTLYTDFVRMGVRGFWNDMNEPALFKVPSKTMPLNTVHSVEGRLTDHREIHNVLGMENVHGTHDGLLKLLPNVRPFVLTRAGYAGTQRYAATWTGDNTASWNHMRLSLPQMMNLGLSGFSFVGADIGGFNGSATPELLTRWMELGVFNPIYRNHSAKDTRYREPWVDGPEHEQIRKHYIETRYRLLPYIYTGMEESSRTGLPLMRPMFLEFPENPDLATNGEEYMFGRSLLVAPRVWPFVGTYEINLPNGDWYDFWTGARQAGGKIVMDPPLETLPVFVRAGSIIPEQPVIQNVDEVPNGPLELRVFPGPDCGGDLYADDGNTLNYQSGESVRLHLSCSSTARSIEVNTSAPQGPFQPWFKRLQITVYGITQKPTSVEVDGRAVSNWKQETGVLVVADVPWAASAHTVKISLSGN